jgi:hypothetical protein
MHAVSVVHTNSVGGLGLDADVSSVCATTPWHSNQGFVHKVKLAKYGIQARAARQTSHNS